jgi:Carbamoyl-phosphate synthetase large chain, oligomerisation domain
LTIEEIFQLTGIDCWFLVLMEEIVDFEEELATAKNRLALNIQP